jgi:hypothetical protein
MPAAGGGDCPNAIEKIGKKGHPIFLLSRKKYKLFLVLISSN